MYCISSLLPGPTNVTYSPQSSSEPMRVHKYLQDE